MKPFWSLHTHSKFSVNDALSDIPEMVERAVELGYPALGLTDHGSVAGITQLYSACKKADIKALPGVELYLTLDRELRIQGHNVHLTVAAYNEKGYRNLCRLITMTAERHFYKPRLDLADLAEMAEDGITQGLAVASGCWFGLVPTVMREQGEQAAAHVLKTLAGWFPRVYVELQNHGIERAQDEWTEDEMVTALSGIADHIGMPYIITSDAHYVRAADQPLHDFLKRITSYNADDPDDAIFPGDPYCLPDRGDLSTYFEPHILDRAIDNLDELAAEAKVIIPELDSYRPLIPDVTPQTDPMVVLREQVHEGMKRHGLEGKRRYLERIEFELEIISKAGNTPGGIAGYLLLVQQVCQFMREKGIAFNARGSANGSVVLWLLDVTGVDALKWGNAFERFLSADRIKLPDVDLDVENARRDEVAEELSRRFVTARVGTVSHYSLDEDDEDTDDDGEDAGKGSLRVRYFATLRKQKLIPPGIKDDWKSAPLEDRQLLRQLSKRKLIAGVGKHAAGWIVAPDQAAIADLPMAYIKGTLVSAYSKDDVEDIGLIKLDLLSVKQLTATRICCELAGITLEELPERDLATLRRINSGNTMSLFQLQGKANTAGLMRMRPTKLEDIVVAQALFRPAAKAVERSFLARRKGEQPVPEMHEDLAEHTRSTYGIMLYQEQVIGVLRTIGMDMAELNKLLKAVKASNAAVAGAKVAVAAALPRIRELTLSRGWCDGDIELLVDAVSGYVEYGFNRAHAVAYGLLAWRTAFLAEHFPHEWWTGALSAYAGTKKEEVLVRAARRNKVRILSPHVNSSQFSYSLDRERNAVRRGLLSVPGIARIGASEIVSKAPYSSLADFGQRVLPKRVSGSRALALKRPPEEWTGAVAKLHQINAFADLPTSDPE